MANPEKRINFSMTGIPQRRPYELNWGLAIGDVHKENHLRSFYFRRIREGPAALGNFVTTRFSCLTKWHSFKGMRRGISIGGEDNLNLRRLEVINFTLSTGYGKNVGSHQAYFYHSPGYAEYLVSVTPDNPTDIPYYICRDRSIPKTAYPSLREVGRLLLSENQLCKTTQNKPLPKPKVREVLGHFFLPFNSSQYPEKEEPLRELFSRFDRLYASFRTEFKKRRFLSTKPKIIDDLLWPQFEDIIEFSLESKLIQFPEPKIITPSSAQEGAQKVL